MVDSDDDGYEHEDEGDEDFCIDCQETFRLDDTGGYNPPCDCGAKCRDCCQADCYREDATRDPEDDE
jgi:hypothetical protein